MKSISVPTSKEAMRRLDLDDCDDGDLIEIKLNDEDLQSIFKTGVANKINETLDINIDDYEDEQIIGTDNLLCARNIIEEYLSLDHVCVLESLLSQINEAIKYDTGVYFYF